jgi:aminocarboxymuconate-semialdehyde decarboxylase
MYDFHTHFIPEDVLAWIKENRSTIHSQWEKKFENKEEFLTINGKWGFELKKSFIDTSLYLKEQAEAGVTHSVISPIPQLFMYDFPDDVTGELSSIYNSALANLIKEQPERISALGTVPLNHPAKAAGELAKAMNNGLEGIIIGPGLSDKMLTDEFFIPLWEEANKQKAIIFIHPLLNEDPRLKKRMMPNLIGVPWETTVCATDLLLSGLLDTYPDIKFLLAHGGGLMPYQIGRMDKGYEQWPQVRAALQAPPSEYLKRFWYDSVLWNDTSLQFLIETVGDEQVVPGSDYPFDLSVWPPQIPNDKGVQSILQK